MNEILEKLENIGLTPSEAKVYLFLLQYKESKAGKMCSQTKIPTSHIYHILENLLEKGIISFKLVNNIKVYRPVDPKNLFLLIKEKEEKLEKEKQELREFIASLSSLELKESRETDFKYFEGFSGVKSMFKEFISQFEEYNEVIIFSAPIAYEKWNAFLLDEFHEPRIKHNVSLRLIVPESQKKFGEERMSMKYAEVKYSATEQESEFGVCGDLVYFLSQGEKPYALLLKDNNFARTQKKIFDVLWNNAKKE